MSRAELLFLLAFAAVITALAGWDGDPLTILVGTVAMLWVIWQMATYRRRHAVAEDKP
jgi:hypothetical protein